MPHNACSRYVLISGGNNINMPVYEAHFQQKNTAIDIIRIIACLLIVWNHISGNMLNKFGNPILWANIGVQIFLFMSGYLYSKRTIDKPMKWFFKNAKKIIKPYWLYLLVIFPVIALLDCSRLTIRNILFAIAGIQGFTGTVEGIGQHWYISYMLLCYLMTPVVLRIVKKTESARFLKGGGTGLHLSC